MPIFQVMLPVAQITRLKIFGSGRMWQVSLGWGSNYATSQTVAKRNDLWCFVLQIIPKKSADDVIPISIPILSHTVVQLMINMIIWLFVISQVLHVKAKRVALRCLLQICNMRCHWGVKVPRMAICFLADLLIQKGLNCTLIMIYDDLPHGPMEFPMMFRCFDTSETTKSEGFSWSADVLSRKVLHLFQKMGQLLVCMGWKPAYVHSWRGGSWFVQVSLVVWSLSRKNTVIYGETRETVVLNWSQHSFPAILHHDCIMILVEYFNIYLVFFYILHSVQMYVYNRFFVVRCCKYTREMHTYHIHMYIHIHIHMLQHG